VEEQMARAPEEARAKVLAALDAAAAGPIPCPPANAAQFWFGLGYEKLSDFGQSIARPLIAWALVLVLSALVYLAASGADRPEPDYWVPSAEEVLIRPDRGLDMLIFSPARWLERQVRGPFTSECVPVAGAGGRAITHPAGPPLWAALQFAGRHAFVITNIAGASGTADAAACLYGAHRALKAQEATPDVPGFVTVLSVLQSLVSVVLLFLMLLAVRNRFRIG